MPRSNDPAEPQSESADLFAEPSSQRENFHFQLCNLNLNLLFISDSSMRSGSEQVAGNMSPRSSMILNFLILKIENH